MQAVLMLALATFPTALQQQQAAPAVYQLFHSVQVQGVMQEVQEDDGGPVVNVQATHPVHIFGSAFAVEDPSGWIMTARHAVDLHAEVGEICEHLATHRSIIPLRIDRMDFDISLTDISGNIWAAKAVASSTHAGTGLCHSTSQIAISWSPGWNMHLVAMDQYSDLALLKLDDRTPVKALSFLSKLPSSHHLAYSFGYAGGSLRTGLGSLAISCKTMPLSEHESRSFGFAVYYMPVQHGISGGPLLYADRVAGVVVQGIPVRDDDDHMYLTVTVPGDYALAWYRYARGLSRVRPKVPVC